MNWIIVLSLVLVVKESLAVIYKLNESEYNLMPPLFGLDEYQSCLLEPGGIYCVVDVQLQAGGAPALMKMIQEYSDYKIKHYNHTEIHRGVCVTSTCKQYMKQHNLTSERDLEYVLEGCLNETLYTEYKLEGKVNRIRYCKRQGDKISVDTSDIIVAVVIVVILVLNSLGSFYDFKYCDGETKGNKFLLAFSVRRNWAKLTAPSEMGVDPRLDRLKLFHGMRTMTMLCVFFSHTVLIMAHSYVQNPLYIETAYEDPLKQILFNGSLVTHTFFVMSAFLLAFNYQLQLERHPPSWWMLPKGVMLRWFRLTPTLALVLALICTWMRHMGHGPLWDLLVTSEAMACRQYWWAHVLYINNYVYDDAYCMPQTWYLAADTQMFIIGLLICVCARSVRARSLALLSVFLYSLVASAAHTYWQDLDAVVMQAPESYRTFYAADNTFRLLYSRGHTNLSTYCLGLAGGFLAYDWMKDGKDFSVNMKYRWLVWPIFPLGVAVILSGGLFYRDGAPASTALKVVYATFYKPVFQLLVVTLIICIIFKAERVYRGIIEWRGFTWTGRAAYCGFLLHTLLQRGLAGADVQTVYMTDYYVMTLLASTTLMSFLCAAALWILLEAPMAALVKALLAGGGKRVEDTKV